MMQIHRAETRCVTGRICLDVRCDIDQCRLTGPCQMPGCCGKGVIGNENVIRGRLVCDYCHAAGNLP